MRKIFALSAILMLVGCASAEPGGRAATSPKAATAPSTRSGGSTPDFWHGYVDGIECIVVVNGASYNSGDNGISCNWTGTTFGGGLGERP